MRLDGIDREIVVINPYRKINVHTPEQGSESVHPQAQLFRLKQESDVKNVQTPTISQEELNKIVEELKHKFSLIDKYLKIDIDEQLKMPISKIIDMRTEEIIRQIPPEWIVDILRRMEELKGVFYAQEV